MVIATGGYSGNKELLKKHYPHYMENLRLYGKPCPGDGLRMAIEAGAATEGLGAVIAMGPLFKGSNYVHVVAMECNTLWVNNNGEHFIKTDASFNLLKLLPSMLSNALRLIMVQ